MSFLKQLLNPFIEFEEDKKKVQAQENKPAAAPITPATPPVVNNIPPPIDENAQHPLVTGSNSVNPTNQPPASQVPTFSPSGTLTGPLPEHEQYFERLIEEANARNPLFQGA